MLLKIVQSLPGEKYEPIWGAVFFCFLVLVPSTSRGWWVSKEMFEPSKPYFTHSCMWVWLQESHIQQPKGTLKMYGSMAQAMKIQIGLALGYHSSWWESSPFFFAGHVFFGWILNKNQSGEIIATSAEVTPQGGLAREWFPPKIPLYNSGLGIIVICPDQWIILVLVVGGSDYITP